MGVGVTAPALPTDVHDRGDLGARACAGQWIDRHHTRRSRTPSPATGSDQPGGPADLVPAIRGEPPHEGRSGCGQGRTAGRRPRRLSWEARLRVRRMRPTLRARAGQGRPQGGHRLRDVPVVSPVNQWSRPVRLGDITRISDAASTSRTNTDGQLGEVRHRLAGRDEQFHVVVSIPQREEASRETRELCVMVGGR